MYCAASENGFEDFSGKSINDLDFTKSKDLFHLSLACIVAAYAESNQESPVSTEDLLYHATPQELTALHLAVISLRAEWYGVSKTVSEQLQKEADDLTEKEKAEAEKNAQPPTSDTADS